MKSKKLIQRLQQLLASGQREQDKQIEALKAVLQDLREKEQKLQHKLDKASDEEHREKFRRKIAVCHAQRAKGLEALRALQGRDHSA